MDNNRLFPIDRVNYQDLEIIRLDEKNICFNAGYYFVPFKVPNKAIEYKQISNSFRFGYEKVEKRFELNYADKIKHFYFKVELGDILGTKEEIDFFGDTFKERTFYDVKKVTIVDDQISEKDGYGYPFIETIKDPDDTKLTINKDAPMGYGSVSETNKLANEPEKYVNRPWFKRKKVFYVYFCSLSLGFKDDAKGFPLRDELSDIVMWNYKGSKQTNDTTSKLQKLEKWMSTSCYNKLNSKQKEEMLATIKKVKKETPPISFEDGYNPVIDKISMIRYSRKRNGDLASYFRGDYTKGEEGGGATFLSPMRILGFSFKVKLYYDPELYPSLDGGEGGDEEPAEEDKEEKLDEIDQENSTDDGFNSMEDEYKDIGNPWDDMPDVKNPLWEDQPDAENPLWNDQPDAENPFWDDSDWLN